MKESILQIVERLEREIKKLDSSREDYEKLKDELLKELKFFQTIFQVGLIKKIDNMDREDLLKIALRNFDEKVLKVDTTEFLSTYDEILKYLEGYMADVAKKRELVEELDFTAEARMCVLFNEDGTPKADFTVAPETSSLIKKQFKLKNYPKTRERKVNIKVSKDFFTDKQLYELCLWKLSSDTYYPGATFIKPNDYNKENEFYKEYPNSFITIETNYKGAKALTSAYSYEEAIARTEKLNKMKKMHEKVVLRHKLETDLEFLKRYIKQIVIDPNFIDEYLRNAHVIGLGGNEYSTKQIYNSSLSDLEGYEFDSYINRKMNK